MQLAACYAGRSFSRGSVGYVHAIGHTLSALYGMGHGHTMSILLPKVMRQYGKAARNDLEEILNLSNVLIIVFSKNLLFNEIVLKSYILQLFCCINQILFKINHYKFLF